MRRAILLSILLLAARRSAADDIATFIRQNAVPLKTAEAGHGLDDMAPIGDMVGDARIVALGEATHGTREFNQLKHRMLEYLVTKKGFTVFGIEASFPEALAVNDYVLNGTGDPAAALEGLGFWTWNTEEVLDQIKWMRAWNADPAHAQKVKFLGFDMQNPAGAEQKLREYFAVNGIDPGEALKQRDVKTLTSLLEAHRAKTEAWELARQMVTLLEQGRAPITAEGRDRSMATNVKWILEHQPAGTKIVLWAHNGHVLNWKTAMGSWLRKWYGGQYVIFGFAFDHGEFRAVELGKALRTMSAPPAPVGTLDALLAAHAPPLAALDLRRAKGEAKAWLGDWQRTKSIGAVYDEAHPEQYFAMLQPGVAYDVVLFVAQTTASRGVSNAALRPMPAPKAANLDFEDGLTGWKNSSAGKGYVAQEVTNGCARGKCAQLVSETERPLSAYGVLMQRVDATPYRGKKVRFHAKVRSDIPQGSSARLWLRVDRPQGAMGFFDNMGDRAPGPLPQWTDFEITGDVAGDAEAVAFGLLFTGEGTAWIDEASLDVVDPVAVFIHENAVALKTAEAGHGLDDMAPIGDMVGDARIVALGEATHGTREFNQLKHRMLEYLVTKKGFNVFAIEVDMPAVLPVNDYVLNGTGDADTAVSHLYAIWDTDELLAMVTWMRAWNADPKHTKKLKFLGIDMQDPDGAVEALRAYFKAHGIDGEEALKKQDVKMLTTLLETHREKTEAWELARLYVTLIEQGHEGFTSAERDLAMATNAKWILGHEPEGTKLVLWAHNGHVHNLEPWMGSWLRKWYGDQLVIFGFAFDRGEFRAIQYGNGFQPVKVAPAPAGTFDDLLAANAPPIAALDLRRATGEAKAWLAQPQKTRSIGATFDPARAAATFVPRAPGVVYDVVLFVADTTAARVRPRKKSNAPPPAPAAVNLQFEDGVKGWQNTSSAFGYNAHALAEGCVIGKCAQYARDGNRTGPSFGMLSQRIDATPYRGKTIRFRAKVRSEIPDDGSARIWLRVAKAQGEPGFFSNMGDRVPGALPQWTDLDITGPVAADAQVITFGLLLTGNGTAWIDDASLEVVP